MVTSQTTMAAVIHWVSARSYLPMPAMPMPKTHSSVERREDETHVQLGDRLGLAVGLHPRVEEQRAERTDRREDVEQPEDLVRRGDGEDGEHARTIPVGEALASSLDPHVSELHRAHLRVPDERARLRTDRRPARGRRAGPCRVRDPTPTSSCSTPAASVRTPTTSSTATSATSRPGRARRTAARSSCPAASPRRTRISSPPRRVTSTS